MKYLLYILFLGLSFSGKSQQNLVPNPSFENNLNLPFGPMGFSLVIDWNNVNPICDPYPYPSPDYFHVDAPISGLPVQIPNTAFGVVSAYDGDAISGICMKSISPDYREYISTQLTSPMLVGVPYNVTLWVTNGASNQYSGSSISDFGIHLSTNPLYQQFSEPIPVTPQLTVPGELWETEWTQLSFTFLADSAYSHITIGNFLPDSLVSTTVQNSNADQQNSSYVFLDGMSVSSALFPEIVGNPILCRGDSVTLQSTNDTIVTWALSSDSGNIISSNPSITVSPDSTTTYVVTGTTDVIFYTVYVIDYPTIDLGNDTTLCEGETFVLDASYPFATYSWNTGDTLATLEVDQSGVYSVETSAMHCTVSDTIVVNFNPLPEVDLGIDSILCDGDVLLFDVTTPNADYLWQDNSTEPTMAATETGLYWVEVTVNDCSSRDSALATFYPNPTIYFGNEATLCLDDSLLLDATNLNATYLWQDGSEEPKITVYENGIYTVIVEAEGCTTEHSINVTFEDCRTILEMPNVFTPNGDLSNDVFTPLTSLNVFSAEIVIQNRWGDVVYKSDDFIHSPWNGTFNGRECIDGVYFWRIEYQDYYGQNHSEHGFVQLIRN